MAAKIVFVDDEPNVLKAFKRVCLDEPYEVLTFNSPLTALKEVSHNGVSVVVSDQRMPEMDGTTFLENVRQVCPNAIRILMTGNADLDTTIGAINRGHVYRFIRKPWEDQDLKQALQHACERHDLILENRRLYGLTRSQNEELRHLNRDLEHLVDVRTEEIRGNEEKLRGTLDKLRKAMGATIEAMARTVEIRDPYTAGHQKRVADLARAIGTEIGLPEERIDGIRMAGVIHDLGKIYVPAEILNRPGGLSEIEFAMIKPHPQVAYDILKDIEFPWSVARIVLQHHERMDGSGYPQGLAGDGILLEARIIAVADVVEAMASHRPYRPALGVDRALEEISSKRGVHFDPEAVDACLKLFQEKGFDLK